MQQFMDRCTNAIYDAHSHVLSMLDEEEAAGYKRALRSTISQHFTAGLLPSIRSQVMANANDQTDKAALLKIAVAIEACLVTRSSMASLAEVQAFTDYFRDTEIGALTRKIANLKAVAKGRSHGGQNPRGGRNRNRN